MGIALPQLAPASEDRASGAQMVDGSLKFDGGYLTRTQSSGNTKTITYSFWINKLGTQFEWPHIIGADQDSNNRAHIRWNQDSLQCYFVTGGSAILNLQPTRKFRDYASSWYHIVLAVDLNQSTSSDRAKLYVNGVLQTDFAYSTYPSSSDTFAINNSSATAIISGRNYDTSNQINALLSQCYLIDGLALGPGYFGYTDPLTNTWRPKKFKAEGTTVNDGTVWSSYLTTSSGSINNIANAFDGDTTTYNSSTANDAVFTFTPPTPIRYKNSVRIWLRTADHKARINGGTYIFNIGAPLAGQWMTLATGSGLINTIDVQYTANSSTAINAIEVDGVIMIDSTTTNLDFGTNGFYLPMDGNSPIGHDKSNPNPVNNGTVWSSGAGANFESANPASNGFNGSADSYTRTDNANVTATVTLPSAVPFTTLQVRGARDSGNGTITVNGVNVSSQYASGSATLQTITLTGVSSPLTSIALTGISGSAQPRFSQIIVDGVILIDNMYGNGWTPVNFGGSVALDNPQVSGARPILNTGTGGTVARPGVFGSELNQTIAVTVSNASGNNKYYLDGSLTPNLAFTRGSTITFNTGDSSGNGHPFKLSSTNASGSAGTEYTDGVAYYINGSVVSGSDYVTNYSSGAASGFRGIKWTVPHNQSTTYYYCTIHTGMGNNGAFTSTIDETKADPYAWKNVLALPLVGSDGDVSNSVNSGSTTKVTASTNAVASSAASNFYGGSWIFDGSGDYIAVTDNADLAFGTGDSTVELWVYPNTLVSNDCLYDGRQSTGGATTGFSIVVNSSGNVQTYTAGGYRCSSTAQLKIGKWSHIAVVRSSGTDTLFMDGIAQADTDTTNGNYTDQKCRIGSDVNGDESWGGHISDFRLYKGVAKYTSNFVVPATSPDILPDTPSGVSGGSKLAKVTDGAVSFDGSGDYLSIADSSDLTVGTNPFTLEFYAYKTAAGEDFFCGSYDSSGTTASLSYAIQTGGSSPTNSLVAHVASGGSATSVNSGVDFVLNKWVHVAFVRDGNTLRLFQDGIQMSTAAFSATVNDASNAFEIGRAGFSGKDFPGFISNFRFVNGTALYTSNFTPPTRELTNVTNTKLLCCQSNTLAGSAAVAPDATGYTGTSAITLSSASLDAGAVANIVDGNTGTSADIRGAGSFVQMVFPQQQNGTLQVNVANGNDVSDDNIRVFIDGVEGTSFDVSSQSWLTIHTGNFTTVKLEHQGSTTGYIYGFRIGTGGDTIINDGGVTVNGDATATNFNPFNTDINTVRGQETGYPTWNPLVKSTSTLSNGNLTITTAASGYILDLVNTFTPAGTGRWYWEFVTTALTGTDYTMVGMLPEDNDYPQGGGFVPYEKKGISVYIGYDGDVTAAAGAATAVTNTATFTIGDVLGWAFDAENGTVECYKNGVSQGIQFTSVRTDVGWAFCLTDYDHTNASTHEINYGQKPFKFPPPAGFQPLNAANVKPETVIARPDQYVGVTTYIGITQSPRTITLPITPDFIWVKNRDTAKGHFLLDTVRGDNNNIRTDGTYDQSAVNGSSHGILSTIGNNSFSVKDGSSTGDNVGSTGTDDYVAWFWKAGGNKNTFNVDDVGYASAAAAGITGLDGTGEMTTAKFLGCSIGTKQGFSIIKYRGLGGGDVKVPHGLSQTPDMVIVKNLDETVDWAITHSGLPGNRSLRFTTASTSTSGFLGLNKGGLASTYFTVNYSDTNLNYVNSSNDDFIAYLWHDVPGLQKFGSYPGNGSATDGTFIELGFKPAVVMIKNTVGYTENWLIFDNQRNTYNPTDNYLYPNLSAVEADDYYPMDFLSNGFKLYNDAAAANTSGNSAEFIYAAWAEAPTVNLYGGQSNAR